ncbi:hypothetical protein MKK68_00415, partial [Methylobacterium sp. E-016]|uniref:hypothetical protein n=1 Tax=Methylobacterium sp. E-016 TaxID=2836556 RepID=UPI001FB9B0B9
MQAMAWKVDLAVATALAHAASRRVEDEELLPRAVATGGLDLGAVDRTKAGPGCLTRHSGAAQRSPESRTATGPEGRFRLPSKTCRQGSRVW